MNEIQLTQKLVQINSENPPGNEEDVARFIYSYLKKIGLNPQLIRAEGKRYNVVASIGQSGPGLMLNGHMDTVPIGEGWNGLSGKIKSGKLYGRGAGDMKSGVAAIIAAVENILKERPKFKRELLLTFVADEETGGIGTKYLIKKKKEIFKNIKYGVVGECTGMKILTAQKGPVDFKIIFRGKSAHGSMPELGDNAILKAAKFIVELDKLSRELKKVKDPILGSGTINVGVIKGGSKVNMVPDYCEVEIDRRFTPKESVKAVLDQIKNITKKLNIGGEIEIKFSRNPMKISDDAKIVQTIKKFAKAKTFAMTGYTEVEQYFKDLGMQAVSFGPGPMQTAHIKNEWVKIKDVQKATALYEKLIREICL